MSVKSRFFLSCYIIFLLWVSFASAAGFFSVASTPVKSRIMINEEAKFVLTIENRQDFDDDFRIYYSDIEWDFATEPRTDSTVHIKAGDKRDVVVVLKPIVVGFGSYGVTINIKSIKTDKLIRHRIFINIISLGLWSPGKPVAVRTEVSAPKEIDPREPLNIKINLRNLYAINVSDLVVSVKSSFFDVQGVVDLRPLEERPVEFVIDLNPREPPKTDVFYIKLTSENQTFKEVEKVITVLGYSFLRKEELGPVLEFLKTDKKVVITNEGNARSKEVFKVGAPAFSALYVFSQPKAGFASEDGKNYLVWDIELEPGEALTIEISKNFRPLVLVLILIALTVIGYYVFRSPIVVKKETAHVELEEGGISQIKVSLHIKNRSRSELKNVRVFDRIPNIADVVGKFKVGSLQPAKILKHERKGTIVKWVIDGVEGFEERIIIYKIRARLTILGTFNLPPAIVKFQDKKGRERKSYSNVLIVRY